jgi:ribosomal protein S18 acetylase RimI-like enzyme
VSSELELDRALDFEEAVHAPVVERVVPFRRGHACFNDTFPHVWDLNLVRIEDPAGADAAELAAEAERLHGEAGHGHRRVSVRGEAAGAALADGFLDLGWQAERFVYMAHRAGRGRGRPDVDVVEVGSELVVPLREEVARGEPWATSEDVVRMVVDAGRLTARVAGARHFAVRTDAGLASAADLYADGRTAQVEDVVTAAAHRNRGYGSAVVLRAVEEALAGGNDLVFLVADDEDWPKALYGKLGFEPIGRRWSFLKTPAA